jgi:hypothetical protein
MAGLAASEACARNCSGSATHYTVSAKGNRHKPLEAGKKPSPRREFRDITRQTAKGMGLIANRLHSQPDPTCWSERRSLISGHSARSGAAADHPYPTKCSRLAKPHVCGWLTRVDGYRQVRGSLTAAIAVPVGQDGEQLAGGTSVSEIISTSEQCDGTPTRRNKGERGAYPAMHLLGWHLLSYRSRHIKAYTLHMHSGR